MVTENVQLSREPSARCFTMMHSLGRAPHALHSAVQLKLCVNFAAPHSTITAEPMLLLYVPSSHSPHTVVKQFIQQGTRKWKNNAHCEAMEHIKRSHIAQEARAKFKAGNAVAAQ